MVEALRYKPEGPVLDSRGYPSGPTMSLVSTHFLTEMSTRYISWGVKAAGAYGPQPYHLYVLFALKSGSLNLLEPSESVQACNGIALSLPFTFVRISNIQIEDQSLNIRSTKRSNATFSRVRVSVSGSDTVSIYCHMK